MKYLSAPTEYKALSEPGTFEGYASIFGNEDLGGDVIEVDAFKEFAYNSKGRIIVLQQHNQKDPIGTARVTQDSKGLAFEATLVMDAPSAKSAYALMKADALSGMSVGYDVLKGGAKMAAAGVRKLTHLKLWEISPVTFGMNPLAGISGVKSIIAEGRLPSLSEFEDFLREAGFSNTQAKAVAGHGLRKLLDRCEADGDEAKALQLLKGFRLPSVI